MMELKFKNSGELLQWFDKQDQAHKLDLLTSLEVVVLNLGLLPAAVRGIIPAGSKRQ